MSSLSYPSNLNENDTDCVRFSHRPYTPNDCSNYAQRGASPPSSGKTITLYMPPTTPPAGYAQQWNDSGDKFAGYVGKFKRDLASSAAGLLRSGDLSGVKNTLSGGMDNAGPLAREMGLGFIGNLAGMSKNELLGMTEGRIFNPNVEVLYNGPQLRAFNFSFNMVAFNRKDSERISQIIQEFKAYSAPEIQEDSMFMTIPEVWDIYYVVKGARSKYMNSFKTCVMTELSVQDNGGASYHSTLPDGEPMETTVIMKFNETKMVTRKDHLSLPRGF